MKLIRSRDEEKLLNYYYLNPHARHYLRELARIFEVDPSNLQKKLWQLESIGLFISEKQGKERYYRINDSHPLYAEYKALFSKTTGVPHILKKTLRKIKGIRKAYIYGSFARDMLTPESDIDLLIIGNVSHIEITSVLLPLEKTLGRYFQNVILTEEEFEQRRKNKDPFLKELFKQPLIHISL